MAYYKVGHEEATIRTQKGMYKTLDNGLTWELVTEDVNTLNASLGGVDVLADDTGVYYLDNNGDGLGYTKALDSGDGQNLLVASTNGIFNTRPKIGKNKTNGEDINSNYSTKKGRFFILVTKTAIYTSYDGKDWKMETNGRFYDMITKDYKCIGPSGCYNILNEEYLHQKKVIVDEYTTDDELNNYLIFALNNIYLPTISYYNTGLTIFVEGENYTRNNKENSYAMSGEDVYSFSDFSSLIDWKADVGMFPFDGITLADLIDTDVAVQENTTFKIEDNKKISDAIIYVTNFYAKKKKQLLLECSEELKNIEPTGDFAKQLSQITYNSDQEKINAFEMYRDYINAAKGGALEVYNKYLEAIHFLDDYRAKKVIKAALYETVMQLAPEVKGLLYDTRREAAEQKTPLEVDFFKIQWDYDYGLFKAYQKYMKYIRKNFIRMSEGGDKEIIGLASLYYRTEIRPEILERLNRKLLKIDLHEELERYYSNYIKEMKDYTSGLTTVKPRTDIPEDFVDIYYKILRGKITSFLNECEYPKFAYNEEFINLSEDEKNRALKYLKEIWVMFKKRVIDYLAYINKKNPIVATNNIVSIFINWENDKNNEKPSWISEIKRLNVELRDAIVFKFIEEEDKI